MVGGGNEVVVPDSPVTNSAGQLDVRTCTK
jgi:hypothetical protein